MISRRKITQLIGALPLIGPAAFRASVRLDPSGTAPSYGIGNIAGAAQGQNPVPIEPLMSRSQAIKILLSNPEFKKQYTSVLYEGSRSIGKIDPDLQILKSLSPMAKITFQRQRNVERALNHDLNPEKSYSYFLENIFQKALDALRWPKV